MNCPYPDCEKKNLHGVGRCPQCHRRVKPCAACRELNRMMAVSCRACGSRVPDGPGQWTGFQGGGDRRGLNPRILSAPLSELSVQEVGKLELEEPCLDLLFYDGYLIAVSSGGTVQAMAIEGDGASRRWSVPGGTSAHACIAHGILYVAVEKRIVAFSLVGDGRGPLEVYDHWSTFLDGIPIHALLVQGSRLYVNVGFQGGGRQVAVLEGLDQRQPGAPEILFEDAVVSPVAAGSSPDGEVLFLSEAEGRLRLHRISRDGASGPWRKVQKTVQGPGSLLEHRNVAALGRKFYAVAGEDDRLCRFDVDHGLFDEYLCTDTRAFALSGIRNGAVLQTRGVYFLPQGLIEATDDAVVGHPVILRERAVAVGLADGRLRLHDLQNPAAVSHHRVASRAVTTVASAEHYIAAGSEDGTVRLWALVERES